MVKSFLQPPTQNSIYYDKLTFIQRKLSEFYFCSVLMNFKRKLVVREWTIMKNITMKMPHMVLVPQKRHWFHYIGKCSVDFVDNLV